MNHISAQVKQIIEVTPETVSMVLKAPEIAMKANPGQFLMIDCGPNTILRRPVSIHRIISKQDIGIFFKITGKGTGYLSRIGEAEQVDLIGPLGNGFEIKEKSDNLLLIAGGIGIAPLIFLAGKAINLNKKVTMLVGANTASQHFPRELIPGSIKVITTTADGSSGKKGLVTDIITESVNKYDQVFACGPVNMYKTLSDILKAIHYQKPVQVSLEVRMGCGFGICYGCTINTISGLKQVCKDGPVFNINEIDWEWVKV